MITMKQFYELTLPLLAAKPIDLDTTYFKLWCPTPSREGTNQKKIEQKIAIFLLAPTPYYGTRSTRTWKRRGSKQRRE